jgi:hypothetical protein
MRIIEWLRDYLRTPGKGLERFCHRYYGLYPGRVVDNQDPEGRGRILATCPAINVFEESQVSTNMWMLPCMNGLGTTPDGQVTGVFHPPEVKTNVWIAFQFGDPGYPVYMGGFVTTKQEASTFESDDMEDVGPTKRGIRTKAGHFIRFNDDSDALEITIARGDGEGDPTSQFLSLTKEGSTIITNDKGSTLYMNSEDDETTLQTLDDQGNVLSMLYLGDDKITLMTKSGGALSIDGKDIVLTGDNVVADANKQFSANAGTVMLGKGASEPVIRGNKFALGWGLIHQHTSGVPGSPTATGATPPVMLYRELSESVFIS